MRKADVFFRNEKIILNFEKCRPGLNRPSITKNCDKRFRKMGIREITVAGLWAFATIALIGGLYGKLDGFVLMIFFIIAVVISVGMVFTPPNSEPEGPKKVESK